MHVPRFVGHTVFPIILSEYLRKSGQIDVTDLEFSPNRQNNYNFK